MAKRVVTLSLHPSMEQAAALEATMHAFNGACQYSSDVAWERQEFGHTALHHLVYYDVRQRFGLSSQLAVRAIGVVTDSYKADRSVRHTFRPQRAVVYDDRVMKLGATTVALRTLTGRESIRWAAGGYQRNQLAAASKVRQADLLYRTDKRRWRLAVTIELPDAPCGTPGDVIGVDQGIVNVAVTSDDQRYGGSAVLGHRRRYFHLRRKLPPPERRRPAAACPSAATGWPRRRGEDLLCAMGMLRRPLSWARSEPAFWSRTTPIPSLRTRRSRHAPVGAHRP